jgi:hypothetical protein
MFWDVDDLLAPGALTALRGALEADPQAVLASAAIVHEDTGLRSHWPRGFTAALARRRRAFGVVQSICGLFPTTGSSLIRADAVRDARGFADADGGDDWVLGVSLAFRGGIVLLDEPGRIYRHHADSVSAQWRSVPDLVGHARAVRDRLASDPKVPRTVRIARPLIAVLQLVVIFALRPLRLRLDRTPRSGRRVRARPVESALTQRPTGVTQGDVDGAESKLAADVSTRYG